jgi:hypothetical protein
VKYVPFDKPIMAAQPTREMQPTAIIGYASRECSSSKSPDLRQQHTAANFGGTSWRLRLCLVRISGQIPSAVTNSNFAQMQVTPAASSFPFAVELLLKKPISTRANGSSSKSAQTLEQNDVQPAKPQQVSAENAFCRVGC